MTLVFSTIFMQTIFFLCITSIGNKLRTNEKFYRSGKGTLRGKIYFSIALVISIFFPYPYQDGKLWMLSITIVLLLLVLKELYRHIDVINKMTVFLTLSSVVGLVGVSNNYFNYIEVMTIVIIAFFVDLFSNFIGVTLSKLPDEYQCFRLRYPIWISSNKSFSSAILSIVIVTAITYNYYDPFFVISAGIGAVFGDIITSIFKRSVNIKDFYPTLGPIGGVLDRVDSWIFAILFSWLYLVIV